MELRRQEPGVVFQFDDFDKPTVRRQPAQHESLRKQLLTVRVIEFVAVPMALAHFAHPVHLLGQGALPELAEIGSEPHGPAFSTDGLLIRHQMNDGIRGGLVEFRAVGAD